MSQATLESDETSLLSSAASIVHDLRNPLAAIHGSAEMLVHSRLSQPQVTRLARTMYSASVRMGELLDEFFDRSRAAHRNVEGATIADLVADAIDKIALNAETQRVQITRVIPEGLAVRVERHRMDRVLVNLLVNALEAMPDGGSILISAVSDERSVWIKIRDTGPGIPAELKGRLFEPYATSGKAGGVGLGLAFSRQAVIEQGGDIWTEPSPRGACFVVKLPRSG